MRRQKNGGKNLRNRIRRQREQQLLGSNGAASEVRYIDPVGYEPQPTPQPKTTALPPPTKQKQIRVALDAADALLVADANRRHGRRHGQRIRDRIVRGRYR